MTFEELMAHANSHQENEYKRHPDTEVKEKMRMLLVDWLIEVHLKFKLVPETLWLAVDLLDRRSGLSSSGSMASYQLYGKPRASTL